jgi:excisionase family DNA binding protein
MRLLTIAEAAQRLAVGRSTAYELINGGYLSVVHIGRAARVPESAIDDCVARLQREEGECGADGTYGRLANEQRRRGLAGGRRLSESS